MNRKNLLVVRAGETSLHPRWLRGAWRRNFDILVSYYGSVPNRYRAGADHYHVMTGPRWPAHDEICREQAALIANYDYVCFACDDLGANARTWNKLFAICRRENLDLAQPAVAGHTSHDITRPRRGCALRFTNFVEVMCPVFSKKALQLCSVSFAESVSGWGLEQLWWSRLGESCRVAIVDSVRIRHDRMVGEGTLYGVLKNLGVNAKDEAASLRQAYGHTKYEPAELSRRMRPPHGLMRRLVPSVYKK